MDASTLTHWRKTIKKILSDLAAIPFPRVVNMQDGTEDGIATDLLAAGIPKESIVLGFKSAYSRKVTSFAVDEINDTQDMVNVTTLA